MNRCVRIRNGMINEVESANKSIERDVVKAADGLHDAVHAKRYLKGGEGMIRWNCRNCMLQVARSVVILAFLIAATYLNAGESPGDETAAPAARTLRQVRFGMAVKEVEILLHEKAIVDYVYKPVGQRKYVYFHKATLVFDSDKLCRIDWVSISDAEPSLTEIRPFADAARNPPQGKAVDLLTIERFRNVMKSWLQALRDAGYVQSADPTSLLPKEFHLELREGAFEGRYHVYELSFGPSLKHKGTNTARHKWHFGFDAKKGAPLWRVNVEDLGFKHEWWLGGP